MFNSEVAWSSHKTGKITVVLYNTQKRLAHQGLTSHMKFRIQQKTKGAITVSCMRGVSPFILGKCLMPAV